MQCRRLLKMSFLISSGLCRTEQWVTVAGGVCGNGQTCPHLIITVTCYYIGKILLNYNKQKKKKREKF